MDLLTSISEAIETYAWHILWVGAVLSAVEFALPKSRYSLTSRVRGCVFWAVYILITASLLTIFARFWGSFGFTPLKTLHPWHWFESDNAAIHALQYIAPILIAVIFSDFFYYWFHRLQHASRFLWRFHSVHHSIREMSAWNSNHHVTEELFRIPFMTIPMSLAISVDPGPVIPIISLIIGMQGLFEHSCTRLHLGIFRYVIADNRFHRIHHSLEKHHWNKNFGSASSVWDVVFRTAHMPRSGEWPDVGLNDVDEPKTVRDFLSRPFRRLH